MPPAAPRLLLAACLGLVVAVLIAVTQRLRRRRFAHPPLSAARAAAVERAARRLSRRHLPSDRHTAPLPNTRDLASYLPITPGRIYRTASPLAGGGGGAAEGAPATATPASVLVSSLGVTTLVDLRSQAEWTSGDDGAALSLNAAVHRFPPRPDRPGRDALIALATHWHRAVGRVWRGRRRAGWHPPPPDPPLLAAAVPPPSSTSLTIIHAPVQAWARYLRTFVLGHTRPADGLSILAAFAHARLKGSRPPVPAVRARLEAATAAVGLPSMYAALLDGFGPEIVGAVGAVGRALVEGEASSAAVACKLGKDRTGLVCALLGLAAGAPEDAVLADYAASASTPSLTPPPGFSALAGAPPAALAAALDHLDVTHGGWEGYLEAHGYSRADQAALAAVLRENE